MHYLLPLRYDEFIAWYRWRDKRVLSHRLVPARLDAQERLVEDERTAARVRDALPRYEDDWEVLLGLVALEDVVYQQADAQGFPSPAHTDLDLMNLRAIFPVSERGARLLGNRLDENVTLGAPLFADVLAERQERHDRTLALRGGYALLDFFGLDAYSDALAPFENEVWQAAQRRHREETCPVPGGTFADDLLCYDRHKPYPPGPLGFAHDFGKICVDHWNIGKGTPGNEPLKQSLTDYKHHLQRFERQGRDHWEALDTLRPVLRDIESASQDQYSAESCLAFLQAQATLRETPSAGALDALCDSLKALGLERELAMALWLVGTFFDFTPFAAEFYADLHAPFTSSPIALAPVGSPEAPTVPKSKNGHAKADPAEEGEEGPPKKENRFEESAGSPASPTSDATLFEKETAEDSISPQSTDGEEEAPAPSDSTASEQVSGVQPYVRADLPDHSETTLYNAPKDQVIDLIEQTVAAEGPIHLEVVTERIFKEVYGSSRMSSRARSTIKEYVATACEDERIEQTGDFLVIPNVRVPVRDRSQLADASFDHVAPQEIEAAIELCLHTRGSQRPGNLAKNVRDMLGFGYSSQIEDRIGSVLEGMQQTGVLGDA